MTIFSELLKTYPILAETQTNKEQKSQALFCFYMWVQSQKWELKEKQKEVSNNIHTTEYEYYYLIYKNILKKNNEHNNNTNNITINNITKTEQEWITILYYYCYHVLTQYDNSLLTNIIKEEIDCVFQKIKKII